MTQAHSTPPPIAVAMAIHGLSTGDLASLRRMKEDRPDPVFWRLHAGKVGSWSSDALLPAWTRFMPAVARLTRTAGRPGETQVLHSERMGVETAFLDKGVPAYSAGRMDRLIGARSGARADGLLRLLRGRRVERIDVFHLMMLIRNDPAAWNRFAAGYYRAEYLAKNRAA